MSFHRLKTLWQLERSLALVNAALAVGSPWTLVHQFECSSESELNELANVRVTWATIRRAHYIREIQAVLC